MYCVWYIHIHSVRYVCIHKYIYTHKYVCIRIFILIYRYTYIYMSKSQRWLRFVWLTCKTHFVLQFLRHCIHPRKLTWNQTSNYPLRKGRTFTNHQFLGFYVSLGGCSLAGIFIPKWSPASAIQLIFSLASLELTVRAWNWMVGRWLSFLGRISFRECNLKGYTWRIIPVSQWLVTPIICKPFRPFGRGITPFRGLTNHGY